MTYNLPCTNHSFSMINLVKLMPSWDWDVFDQILAQTGLSSVELVPSLLLGPNWDKFPDLVTSDSCYLLEKLTQRYKVGSIQSLTYGLDINLADDLRSHHGLARRLEGLVDIGHRTNCFLFILGSPGQKKQIFNHINQYNYKSNFIDNCAYILSTIGSEFTLSLEHNTSFQGAEFCNTLGEISEVVQTLRERGFSNIGLNLDTKCLIDEMGPDFNLEQLLADESLKSLISSIQVGLDFLTRDCSHCKKDKDILFSFSRKHRVHLSFEEFGLSESQLLCFTNIWPDEKTS